MGSNYASIIVKSVFLLYHSEKNTQADRERKTKFNERFINKTETLGVIAECRHSRGTLTAGFPAIGIPTEGSLPEAAEL